MPSLPKRHHTSSPAYTILRAIRSDPWLPTPPATTEPGVDEKPLTAEEGWALFWSLEGNMKGWFPEEGGASGILRKEREDWGE